MTAGTTSQSQHIYVQNHPNSLSQKTRLPTERILQYQTTKKKSATTISFHMCFILNTPCLASTTRVNSLYQQPNVENKFSLMAGQEQPPSSRHHFKLKRQSRPRYHSLHQFLKRQQTDADPNSAYIEMLHSFLLAIRTVINNYCKNQGQNLKLYK